MATTEGFNARRAAQQEEFVSDVEALEYDWHSSTTNSKFVLGANNDATTGSVLFEVTEWAEQREEVFITAEEAIALRDWLISVTPRIPALV